GKVDGRDEPSALVHVRFPTELERTGTVIERPHLPQPKARSSYVKVLHDERLPNEIARHLAAKPRPFPLDRGVLWLWESQGGGDCGVAVHRGECVAFRSRRRFRVLNAHSERNTPDFEAKSPERKTLGSVSISAIADRRLSYKGRIPCETSSSKPKSRSTASPEATIAIFGAEYSNITPTTSRNI